MKKVRMVPLVFVVVALIGTGLMPGKLHADLILNISPDDNDPTMTRWQFSGSTTMATSQTSVVTAVSSVNWDTLPHAATDNYFVDHVYSAATITVAGISSPVASPQMGFGNTVNGLFAVLRDDNYTALQGQVIEWSGDLRVDVDISDFNAGTHTTFDIVGGQITEPWRVIVAGGPAIPEPATCLLMGGLAVIVSLCRRRD